jgi:hypothetical protein
LMDDYSVHVSSDVVRILTEASGVRRMNCCSMTIVPLSKS